MNMSGMDHSSMKGMDHGAMAGAPEQVHSTHPTSYTCRMHPEVKSDMPGKCPKCGMTLVSKETVEKQKQPKPQP